MALTEMSRHKAAILLMGLDMETASELLKGLPSEKIQQLAVEMAQIETSGHRDQKKEAQVVHEFYDSLEKEGIQRLSVRNFLNETLVNVLGEEKAEEIQSQVAIMMDKKNPFEPIRLATTDELVLALENESPATIALILPELESAKAGGILSLLDREVCSRVVLNMTKPVQLRGRVKQQIASAIGERLGSFKGETLAEKPEEILRSLAIVLSDVQKDVREQVLDEINKDDQETGTMVRNLMVTWEDIPTITDRSLQEAMRGVDSSKLALAMCQADEEVIEKIRSNISQRAAAAVDEEISLMQEPLEEEIIEAREEVVAPLRKANEEGTLRRTRR